MRKVGIFLILTIVGIGALAAPFYFIPALRDRFRGSSQPGSPNGQPSPAAGTAQSGKVVALGRLLPGGGVIDVGAMAGERLGELRVKEQQWVERGDVLAYLESRDLRQAELRQADAQLTEARARLATETAYGETLVAEAQVALEQTTLQPLEMRAQEAQVGSLEANLEVVRADLARLEGLDPSLVSSQERDHQQLLVRRAEDEFKAARLQLSKLKASQEIQQRYAQAQLETARATAARLRSAVSLEALQAARDLIAKKAEQSEVLAPAAGQILRIQTQTGEMLSQQPILQMGNTREMEVVAEVYETDLRRVRPGQSVSISSPALSSPLSGQVTSVGTMIGKNTVVSLDPTASTDARVGEVHIRLDQNEDAARLIRLEVQVQIDVEGGVAPAPNAATARR